MCSQATATKRVGSKLRVGCCRKKVTAKCEENFDPSVVHRLNRLDRVETVISRWLEIKSFAQPVEERFGGSFPDTHGAITLHVAVTAYRTKSCAGLSDLPAQEHQVHDLLDICNRVLMLRQTHRSEERRVGKEWR